MFTDYKSHATRSTVYTLRNVGKRTTNQYIKKHPIDYYVDKYDMCDVHKNTTTNIFTTRISHHIQNYIVVCNIHPLTCV